MRRVIAPALLAVFVFAGSSAEAGFGLFDRLCGHNACDSGYAVEPACGCEVAPACDCEVAAPCCDAAPKRHGLLHRLFHRHHGCDAACAPEPTCGCEVAPVDCGCQVAEPCCDAAPKRHGLLHRLFHRHHDCGCNDCGYAAEPACGCEPTCGF